MPMPGGLESLMRAVPPMGRAAPDAGALASGAGAALGGAAPPGGAPAPGAPPAAGGAADPFTSIINSRLSDAGGVDPQFFIDQTMQMKQTVAAMLPKVLVKYPGQVDRQVQNVMRALDALSKAFQEAQQHQAALAGKPIDFAGAQAGPTTGLPASV